MCGAPLDDLFWFILMSYSRVVSVVLTLWKVGPILKTDIKFRDKNVSCIAAGVRDTP